MPQVSLGVSEEATGRVRTRILTLPSRPPMPGRWGKWGQGRALDQGSVAIGLANRWLSRSPATPADHGRLGPGGCTGTVRSSAGMSR